MIIGLRRCLSAVVAGQQQSSKLCHIMNAIKVMGNLFSCVSQEIRYRLFLYKNASDSGDSVLLDTVNTTVWDSFGVSEFVIIPTQQ